jgi:biopolymer transport protein ExbD
MKAILTLAATALLLATAFSAPSTVTLIELKQENEIYFLLNGAPLKQEHALTTLEKLSKSSERFGEKLKLTLKVDNDVKFETVDTFLAQLRKIGIDQVALTGEASSIDVCQIQDAVDIEELKSSWKVTVIRCPPGKPPTVEPVERGQ